MPIKATITVHDTISGRIYTSIEQYYHTPVDYLFAQSQIHKNLLKLETEGGSIVVLPIDVLANCIITFKPGVEDEK